MGSTRLQRKVMKNLEGKVLEIMDIPLIEYIASKDKLMIMSTGVASLSDNEEAVDACRRMRNNQTILLKCTSAYSAGIKDANLHTIPNMKETFGIEVVRDIKKGEVITEENIRSIRPSNGLALIYYYNIISKTSNNNIKRVALIECNYVNKIIIKDSKLL